MGQKQKKEDAFFGSVDCATITNIDLTSRFPVIDDHQTISGDRVLVKNQINGIVNGIYTVSKTGALILSSDSVYKNSYVNGGSTRVLYGNTNIDKEFIIRPIQQDVFSTTAKVFITSPFAGSLPIASSTIYVDDLLGNDGTATVNDISKPFKTITAANLLAQSFSPNGKPYLINVKAGNYYESIHSNQSFGSVNEYSYFFEKNAAVITNGDNVFLNPGTGKLTIKRFGDFIAINANCLGFAGLFGNSFIADIECNSIESDGNSPIDIYGYVELKVKVANDITLSGNANYDGILFRGNAAYGTPSGYPKIQMETNRIMNNRVSGNLAILGQEINTINFSRAAYFDGYANITVHNGIYGSAFNACELPSIYVANCTSTASITINADHYINNMNGALYANGSGIINMIGNVYNGPTHTVATANAFYGFR